MSFTGISYLELWQPSCSVEPNHLCNFCKGQYEEHFCEIHLCNFGRRHHKKQFCEIILIWTGGSGGDGV